MKTENSNKIIFKCMNSIVEPSFNKNFAKKSTCGSCKQCTGPTNQKLLRNVQNALPRRALSLNWWSQMIILLLKLEWCIFVHNCKPTMFFFLFIYFFLNTCFSFYRKKALNKFFPTLVAQERPEESYHLLGFSFKIVL